MKIIGVLIEESVKEKILGRHNVYASEIKEVLMQKPVFLKAKQQRYLAIGYGQRYLTIVFEYKNRMAGVVTAYPSSEAQARLYKKKRKI